MPAPFDPYERWFDIPSNQRPPNHYQLLGVKNFESNLGVLNKAGEKRVQFLQDVSSGEHVVAAQNCLNQVAQAVVVLTNPRKKLAYDRDLKKQMTAASASSTPPAAPVPPPSAVPSAVPSPTPKAAVSEQPPALTDSQAFAIVDSNSKKSARKKSSKSSALKNKGLKSSTSRSAANYSAARAKAKKRQLLILKLAATFILLAIIGILVFILLTRDK